MLQKKYATLLKSTNASNTLGSYLEIDFAKSRLNTAEDELSEVAYLNLNFR